ncbi:hypothetical protein IWW50_001147 [Coemansia erecta]|nr:hypothetical protein IWW50_001147 [Coemansia erecta]
MPNPLEIISMQAHKLQLSDEENAALRQVQSRETRFMVLGFGAGACLGYVMSRRTNKKLVKGLSIFFTSTFTSSLATNYATLSGIRQLADEEKYPRITASLRDISKEFMRSRGIDPDHPERGRMPMHRPDFKHLPPSVPATRGAQQSGPEAAHGGLGALGGEGREDRQHEFGNPALDRSQEQYGFGNPALGQAAEQQQEFGNPALGQTRDQQHEFGNPALKQTSEQQYEFGNPALSRAQGGQAETGSTESTPRQSAPNNYTSWDTIRKGAGGSDNAWDRLRRQGGQQEQKQYGQPSSDVWGNQGQDSSDGGFSGESSGFGADSFPRSREDFQDDWKRESGGSSSTSFAT